MIRKVTEQDDLQDLVKLLNESFITVADEFGLTKENCPTNNAFITERDLLFQFKPERTFFCYTENGRITGLICIEKSYKEESVFYIENLAVHPLFRHLGIGRKLMDYATEKIKGLNGKRVSIALINENVRLKSWYSSLGFEETEIKKFSHLPFPVCFMHKNI